MPRSCIRARRAPEDGQDPETVPMITNETSRHGSRGSRSGAMQLDAANRIGAFRRKFTKPRCVTRRAAAQVTISGVLANSYRCIISPVSASITHPWDYHRWSGISVTFAYCLSRQRGSPADIAFLTIDEWFPG